MHEIKSKDISISFLDNGSIELIKAKDTMINQVKGNTRDGSLMNLYLRLIAEDGSTNFLALTGPKSKSDFFVGERTAIWEGKYAAVSYKVTLTLVESMWFWKINLTSETNCNADLTYVQDLGLGAEAFVTANEAYSSQYIDNYVVQDEAHVTVCSRQNQSQNGKFPYLQQGSLEPLASYATDGFQFYGTEYKATNIPQGLIEKDLPSCNYQYEFTLTALRTPSFEIGKQAVTRVFYAAYVNSRESANTSILLDLNELKEKYVATDSFGGRVEKVSVKQHTMERPLAGESLTATEINYFYPHKKQVEESEAGELLSFFDERDRHIVLPTKEKRQERMTGNIVMAGATSKPGTAVMATTQYMCGIFESQTVFGNTNMNILTTNVRNSLNYFKNSGTRILIKINGEDRLLTMPSLFAMSFNGADWIYKLEDDFLLIKGEAAADSDQLKLEFSSLRQKKYELKIRTQLELATLGKDAVVTIQGTHVKVKPAGKLAEKLPYLQYALSYECADSPDVRLERNGTEEYLVAEFQSCANLSVITGLQGQAAKMQDVENERRKNEEFITSFVRKLELKQAKDLLPEYLQPTELIIKWYIHDALVHLLSPHGLEQYGGAAWGTRDVSQGPAELFLALGDTQPVGTIIKMMYEHQFIENGNWPQWFMFDEYAEQFAAESHGDIIVWPLKVVAEYLKASQDTAILNTSLRYMSLKDKKFTSKKEKLIDHIKRQVEYLKNHFLPQTYVSAYGDGDWDDTLQPANSEQKKTMASTWTQELTLETLELTAEVTADFDHEFSQEIFELKEKMNADFRKYFMKDTVLPGFIRMDSKNEIHYIIHPEDKITQIKYRLLPLQQGILSHVFNEHEKQRALSLIKEHLLFPDGVRLMDRPATYQGGISKIFKRAEQSAFFGREAGLLYVHAHIRYAEALIECGDLRAAWDALLQINPIGIKKRVPNAVLRQANTYFSSSDAAFSDRYQAQQEFSELKHGTIPVKGGWRLYSSGPGIYVAAVKKLLTHKKV
ncbi:hypothetical protein [Liquorilactobacillus satsumensis]|uniref:Cyclic beta 1-2 glucan ligase n=1 Tax=Liquorilactobacillus satsumensis DSM 16230 = JCM 12392 TaxID=1423801 RepID=A0A0R1UV02_9LACO|nr:hypothetical protein [Liquorilactobacillus satsumensis]KRL96993.1 cyclic beta 1-2 glucan ligase [Liquorilactobacillus satsumensis DSM 16230 = JCM 12392]